jgi:hypothetical protein
LCPIYVCFVRLSKITKNADDIVLTIKLAFFSVPNKSSSFESESLNSDFAVGFSYDVVAVFAAAFMTGVGTVGVG